MAVAPLTLVARASMQALCQAQNMFNCEVSASYMSPRSQFITVHQSTKLQLQGSGPSSLAPLQVYLTSAGCRVDIKLQTSSSPTDQLAAHMHTK
jgi:hypothetical protein